MREGWRQNQPARDWRKSGPACKRRHRFLVSRAYETASRNRKTQRRDWFFDERGILVCEAL